MKGAGAPDLICWLLWPSAFRRRANSHATPATEVRPSTKRRALGSSGVAIPSLVWPPPTVGLPSAPPPSGPVYAAPLVVPLPTCWLGGVSMLAVGLLCWSPTDEPPLVPTPV